jgi:hypothetical protein
MVTSKCVLSIIDKDVLFNFRTGFAIQLFSKQNLFKSNLAGRLMEIQCNHSLSLLISIPFFSTSYFKFIKVDGLLGINQTGFWEKELSLEIRNSNTLKKRTSKNDNLLILLQFGFNIFSSKIGILFQLIIQQK